MAASCAISVSNQKKFKTALANVLAGYMNSNSPLSIEAIAKDTHSQILEVYATQPDAEIKALSYVMLIPEAILDLVTAANRTENEKLVEYLNNNIKLAEIQNLNKSFKASFDNIANYVSSQAEDFANMESVAEILMESTLNNKMDNTEISNFQTINNKSKFNAANGTAFKTSIGNVISSTEGTEGFNVERESTKYISEIKKQVIQNVASGKVQDGTAVLPNVGPVYLAPISLNTLNGISKNYPQPIKEHLAKKTTTRKKLVVETPDPTDYTNHSGGAKGADETWDIVPKSLGYKTKDVHYREPGQETVDSERLRKLGRTAKPMSEELYQKGKEMADKIDKAFGENVDRGYKHYRYRNYAQVYYADAVFAISTGFGERAGRFAPLDRGTLYAIYGAILDNKPVYVFDQKANVWRTFQPFTKTWKEIDTPTLTKNFAGVGTRNINENGIRAIQDVYKKTFEPVTEDFAERIDRNIERLEQEKELILVKQEASEDVPGLVIANNWKKIKPDSATKETGGRTGRRGDINPALLSSKGVTVGRAAEQYFADYGDQWGMDDTEIREIIIDILSSGTLAEYKKSVLGGSKVAAINREIQELEKLKESAVQTQGPIALVMIDAQGNPVYFDKNLNASIENKQGNLFVDALPEVNEETKKESITIYQKKLNVSREEAAAIVEQEAGRVEDIRAYLEKNPDNILKLNIKGGKPGYTHFDFKISNPVNRINFEGDEFLPEIASRDIPEENVSKGKAYFRLSSLPGIAIEMERVSINPSFADKIARLITSDVKALKKGYLVSIPKSLKTTIPSFYLNTNTPDFSVQYNPETNSLEVMVLGKMVDLENSQQAYKTIYNYLTTLGPKRTLDKTDAEARIKKGNRVIKSTEVRNVKLEVNDIIATEVGEGTIYRLVEFPKLHFSREAMNKGYYEFDLETEVGDLILKLKQKSNQDYREFIKENSYIHYQVNAENKIVSVNPYLTFDIPQETLNQLYPSVEPGVQTTPEISDEDTDYDYLANWDELPKSVKQKLENAGVTKEKLMEAKAWYEKSIYNDIAPFSVMFDRLNAKNPNEVATFVKGAVTLFKGSDFSDLYHEAFHVFTRTFLKPSQIKSLFDELKVKFKDKTFKNYAGETITFGNASYKEIDEFLAEDFRSYMLNGGKAKDGFAKRNAIFKFLAKIVKAIAEKLGFGTSMIDVTDNQSVYELYERIRVGNINELSFPQENASTFVFAKTVEAVDPQNPVQSLSQDASQAFIKAVDYYIADYMDMMNKELSPKEMLYYNTLKQKIADGETLSEKEQKIYGGFNKKMNGYFTTIDLLKPQGIKQAYKHVKKNFIETHNNYVEQLDKFKDDVTDTTYKKLKDKVNLGIKLTMADKRALVRINQDMEFKALKKKVDYFYWAVQNFGDTENILKNEKYRGIIGYHLSKSNYISKQVVENFEKDLQTEQDKEDFKGFETIGNEVSFIEMMPKEILYLISGLTKYDSKGKMVVNPITGIPDLVEGKKAANKIARIVVGSTTPQEMKKRLEENVEIFPMLQQLLNRLGRVDEYTKEGEYQMWNKFFMSMNLTRRSPKMLNYNKVEVVENDVVKEIVYEVTIGGSPNMDLQFIKSRWNSNIQNLDLEGYDNDKFGKLMTAKNLQKIVDKYKDNFDDKAFDFLKAIGLNVSDAIKDNDVDRKAVNKYAFFIYKKLREAYFQNRKGEEIYTFAPIRNLQQLTKPFAENIAGINADLGTDITKLAEIESKYSESVSEFMYTNAAMKQQYELTKNSSITQMLNAINAAEDFNALTSKPETSHYSTDRNSFVKRSIRFNTIFNFDDLKEAGKKRKYSSENQEAIAGKAVQISFNDLNGVLTLVNNVATEFGQTSGELDTFSKLMIDFYGSLSGIMELPRHADKPSYSSVTMPLYRVGTQVRNKFTDALDLINAEDLSNRQYRRMLFLENELAANKSLSKEELNELEVLRNNMPVNEEMLFLFRNVILPYLYGEHERMMKFRKIEQDRDESLQFDFKYLKAGQNFVLFDDILSPNTKAKLEAIEDIELYFVENPGSELYDQVMSDLRHYFETLTSQAVDDLATYGQNNQFISQKILKGLKTNLIGKKKVSAKNDQNVIRGMARAFNFMTFISNVENNIMFYGDVAQYDDYTKRIALAGSAGIVPRNDYVAHEYINSKGRLYAKSKGYADKYSKFDGTLSTVVGQDVKMQSVYYDEYLDLLTNSELSKLEKSLLYKGTSKKELKRIARERAVEILKPYTEMTEADGQAWISFDTYRYMLMSYDMWLPEQEEMYQKIVDDTFNPTENAMAFFPVLKLQYFGPVYNEKAAINTAHKYSLFPLIPPAIKGRNLEDLHERLMNQGSDYMVLGSGAKVGVISKNGALDKVYQNYSKEQDERKPMPIDAPITPNVIYLPYLKYQTHIAPNYKEEITLPTQMRALVLSDLYNYGVPVDFLKGKGDKEERIEKWNALSDAKKKKASRIYSLERTYLNNLDDLVKTKKRILLNEVEFKEVNGKLVGSTTKLLDFIEKQLERQDVSPEDIEFITQMRVGKLKDLSLSVQAEKMERMLNAIVIKRIGKPTVKGEGLIQVSNMMFEKKENWTEARKGLSKSEKYKVYGSNDLPFYQIIKDSKGRITGVKPMKVIVSLQGDFKKLLLDNDVIALSDSEGIDRLSALNRLLKDEAWLDKGDNRLKVTLTGPRIPTQKQNSMEAAEIFEFLPEAAGNIVVLPSELVAKSGGDFDVDKLMMSLPHLSVRKGKVTLFKPMTRDQIKEMYKEYTKVIERYYETSNALADAMSRALGVNYSDLVLDIPFEEILDDLITRGEAMTLSQFEDKVIGTKAIENEILKSFVDILMLPESLTSLLTPNSTRMLEPLAETLEDANKVVDIKFSAWSNTPLTKMSMTRVLEPRTNRSAHTNNSVGKATLGIGAVDNRWSPLFNLVGMYLNNEYSDKKGNVRRIASMLKHNVTIVNGVPHISMSDIDDVYNEDNIGDKLSEKINGWVDVAKKPWIFYIRGNKIAAPVLLFLTQIGTPREDTIYYASQPMIKEYVDEIEATKSVFADAIGKAPSLGPYAFQFEARKRMILNYRDMFAEAMQIINPKRALKLEQGNYERLSNADIIEVTNFYTSINPEAFEIGFLKDNLYNKDFGTADFAQLLHYFELENYANMTKEIKLKLNFDTAKSRSIYEALQRKNYIDEVKASGFFPSNLVDKIAYDTPVAPFAVQDFQVQLFSRLFPLRNAQSMNEYIEDLYLDNQTRNQMSALYSEEEEAVNTFKNDFMAFLFQKKLKDFSLKGLKFYNGIDVTTEVKEAPGIDFGAAVIDVKGKKVLYVNSAIIEREFKSGFYNDAKYQESKGNAPINSSAFSLGENSLGEYQRFVLERALLTDRYPFSKVENRFDYKMRFNKNLETVKQGKEESTDDFTKRVQLTTYREFLRDMALFNINNVWYLFKSPNNYAFTFKNYIEKFAKQLEQYGISEGLRSTAQDRNTKIANVVIRDPNMSNDTEEMYKENIATLSNYTTEITGDKETDQILTHFFKKMPVIAMFQSGYNMKGMYNLTRLVNKDAIYDVVDAEGKTFLDKNMEGQKEMLEDFYKRWLRTNNNKAIRTRLKDLSYELKQVTAYNIGDMYLGEYGSATNIGTYNRDFITNAESAENLQRTVPNDVFIFEASSNALTGNGLGWAMSNSKETNKLGVKLRRFFNILPTSKYADVKNADGTYSPNPEVVKNIDEFIQEALKISETRKLRFPAQGLGQYMIGLDETLERRAENPQRNVINKDKAPAPLSFQYLSEQLYKHFQYINPRSLDITIPGLNLQKMVNFPILETVGTNIPVSITKENTIEVNTEKVQENFDKKAWTKTVTFSDTSVFKGLPENTFEYVEDYTDYLIFREMAKRYMFQKEGQTFADYLQSIHEEAMKQSGTKREIVAEANNSIDAGFMNYMVGILHQGQLKKGFFRKELSDKKITSTWYAIVAGLRTQTSRQSKNVTYKVGDYIFFKNNFFTGVNSLKNKKLVVRVTELSDKTIGELLQENPNYAETWSKREGWTTDLLKDNSPLLQKYPVGFEFVGIQDAVTNNWDKISNKYLKPYTATRKEIPVTVGENIPARKEGIRPMVTEMVHPDVTNDMVLQKLKFCGIFG